MLQALVQSFSQRCVVGRGLALCEHPSAQGRALLDQVWFAVVHRGRHAGCWACITQDGLAGRLSECRCPFNQYNDLATQGLRSRVLGTKQMPAEMLREGLESCC